MLKVSGVPHGAQPGNLSCALNEHHQQYLAARAVNFDLAAQFGLRSVDAVTGGQLLGRAVALPSGGLAIPYPMTEQAYWRVRLDQPESGGGKDLAPKGRPVPVFRTFDALGEGDVLHVVESPVKALALASMGLKAVGLSGVNTTLEAKTVPPALNASWDDVGLIGREVIIVMDAGRATNSAVARAEARLAQALETRGGRVRVAALPLDAGKDQGPDDFIAKQGADAFLAVVSGALPADPAAEATKAKVLEKLKLVDVTRHSSRTPSAKSRPK